MTSVPNPLLAPPELEFGAVPFDLVRVEHFEPALDAALADARGALESINRDPRRPDFANTIAALEGATLRVDELAGLYHSLQVAHGDAAMHALARVLNPKLMALSSDIALDIALFERIEAVHREPGELDGEQRRLLDQTYRMFQRNGGLLDAAAKAELRRIDDELSTLGAGFAENLLNDTNAYELVLSEESDLDGLPESARETARATAVERGKPGTWVITLHEPSFLGFMRYATSRALRERLWRAYFSRALHGAHSNVDLVRRIAALRLSRARLLGYRSHAHFQLEERMAETPENVEAFLRKLLVRSKPAALAEMAELASFAAERGGPAEILPWDYAHWSNKLKEARFDLESEALRPNFTLTQVVDGVFELARRLYGLEFRELPDLPVYAPEVRSFEVLREGRHLGLLYTDFFPRETKNGGAWCTRFRDQRRDGATDVRPHVSIVCNFTKPVGSTPSLLTFEEVRTLFHEFGHALHGLLSRCTYRSLGGTNVYRDFVELPSQILENWIVEKDCLALFARHWQTGDLVPDEVVDKLVASSRFHAAYQMIRQLRFGFLDLAWYGHERWVDASPEQVDVEAFENDAVRETDLLPAIPGANMSVRFGHIFAGGYAAGYYSYKWAEVLDADAFEYFKERGIFSREVADKFRAEILERGDTEAPAELYRRFRGRDPDPDALLRRAGLI